MFVTVNFLPSVPAPHFHAAVKARQRRHAGGIPVPIGTGPAGNGGHARHHGKRILARRLHLVLNFAG